MRLIDADALIADCNIYNSWDAQIVKDVVKAWIDDQNTIDVEPVRHGHWKHDETGANFCSVCNEYPYDDGEYHLVWHTNYCPNCGAKMDEEVSE